MTLEQADLVERLRARLAGEPGVREVAMFGTRSFMVRDRLAVSATKDGGLLVRVDPGRHEALLDSPGASQAEMGAGRSMGPGWVAVEPDAVRAEEQLASWLGHALEHNRGVAGDPD